MKILIIMLLSSCIFTLQTYAQYQSITELQDQYMSKLDQTKFWNKRLFTLEKLGITRFVDIEKFSINTPLRRDEAAKMLVIFSNYTNNYWDQLIPSTSHSCTFNDLYDSHSDLTQLVLNACENGIFKWTNNKFMPKKSLTNGEFLATVIRVLDREFLDETYRIDGSKVTHRSENYQSAAIMNELLRDTIYLHHRNNHRLDQPVLRWDVAIVLANFFEKFQPQHCTHQDCNQGRFYWPFEYQKFTDFANSQQQQIPPKKPNISAKLPDLTFHELIFSNGNTYNVGSLQTIKVLASFKNIWNAVATIPASELIKCYHYTDLKPTPKKVWWMQTISSYNLEIYTNDNQVDGQYIIDLSVKFDRGMNYIMCYLNEDEMMRELDKSNNLITLSIGME